MKLKVGMVLRFAQNACLAIRSWPAQLGQFVASAQQNPVLLRHIWIVAASCFMGAYTFGVLAYVLTTPEIGVRCAITPEVNNFDTSFMYPDGQTPPKEHDLIKRIGDDVAVNWPQMLRDLIQLGATTPETIEQPSPAAFKPGHDPFAGHTYVQTDSHRFVRIEFQPRVDGPERYGPEKTTWLRLGEPRVVSLLPSMLWFFLKIGLFSVAALVFWKRPEDRSASVFFLLGLASFGAYIGGYHWWRIVTQPALLLVFMVCSVLLPAVSLHFYLVFPRPKQFLQRWPWLTLAANYGPAVLFLLVLVTGYLRVRLLNSGEAATAQTVNLLLDEMLHEIYAYFGVATLWFLACVLCVIHSYRTAANITERNQVRWILFGLVTALVPIGYTLYLAFFEKTRFGGGGATWPMFAASACVTLAFAISITRYRLMRLDQLVSSGFMYFVISFVAGMVYYVLVFAGMLLLGTQVGEGEGPSVWQALAVSSTALVLVIAIDLIRNRFKAVLDRHFRREKHQLDSTLQRMSQAIEQLVDPPTLARRLLQTSAELLGVSRGAIYLRQGDPPLYVLVDSLGPAPQLGELVSGCPLVEALRNHGPQLTRPRPPGATADPAQRQLQLLGGTVAHALTHEGQLLGLLLLGPKAHFTAYSVDDLNLLAAFAQITVLAFVSAEKHRAIEALNRDLQAKVEKIAEQQRRIMALQSQLNADVRGRAGAPQSASDGDAASATATAATERQEPALPEGMIGSSPQVRQLMHLVRKVAASSSCVLLRGESGTGKEVLARAVHDCSPRKGKAFIKVNCAALSTTLLETELFGHIKGAFTNAIRDKIGRFEAADGGTLFLDEIGDISLEVQTKLLRVLQEMTFERVGSIEPIQVDVRVIAATHQDLERLIRQGRFREDLYYRLNVFPVHVPPLRDRIEDIPELVAHFLRLYTGQVPGRAIAVDDDALAALKAYSWPGNVRQLENVIERAAIVCEGPILTIAELPPELLERRTGYGSDVAEATPPTAERWSVFPPAASTISGAAPSPMSGSKPPRERAERERREREQLVRALAASGGNKAEAARALGMARSTIVSRLKRLGLS